MKRYDEEFKRDAVELLLARGKPLAQIARELGVSNNSLTTWRDLHLNQSGGASSTAEGRDNGSAMTSESLAEEIRFLRRENERLTRQRDILKKAALILGEKPQ